MTYRERREARAERLRGWAEKRTSRARATLAADDAQPYAHDIAFLTQPGRIPERTRMNARADRAYASMEKAANMAARAASIDAAAAHAIYSDDPDAPEALRARIDDLEAERARIVAYNADCRRAAKAGTIGDRSILDQRQRDTLASLERSCPYQLRPGRALPPYATSNLSGRISAARDRLRRMEHTAPPPVIERPAENHAGHGCPDDPTWDPSTKEFRP